MPRVTANASVLRRALLACVVLVLAPTTVAVWAATTLDENDHLPKWVTDQQALMEAIEHDNALAEQDMLKPQARGEFGPFLLVGPGDVSQSPVLERCDTETSYNIGRGGLDLADVLSSPLAIPEFSTDGIIAGACDGVVISINGGWLMPNDWGGDEGVNVGMLLIGYLPFRTEWDTAADRTEFGKIDGYPAVIEHPIPGLIMDFPREALIVFAEPKDGRPGIVLHVDAKALDQAAHIAISSLEKRIGEMGLPPNPYN